MSGIKRSSVTGLSIDKALGAVGGGLAVASLCFGVYMNIHGPVASFGHSKDFTVFAQLAPSAGKDRPQRQAIPSRSDDNLDMSATATIPRQARPAGPANVSAQARGTSQTAIIPSITLEAASADTAMIDIDGRAQEIRVGDILPGAGEVLEIRTGRRPLVKTSRGVIVSSRQD